MKALHYLSVLASSFLVSSPTAQGGAITTNNRYGVTLNTLAKGDTSILSVPSCQDAGGLVSSSPLGTSTTTSQLATLVEGTFTYDTDWNTVLRGYVLTSNFLDPKTRLTMVGIMETILLNDLFTLPAIPSSTFTGSSDVYFKQTIASTCDVDLTDYSNLISLIVNGGANAISNTETAFFTQLVYGSSKLIDEGNNNNEIWSTSSDAKGITDSVQTSTKVVGGKLKPLIPTAWTAFASVSTCDCTKWNVDGGISSTCHTNCNNMQIYEEAVVAHYKQAFANTITITDSMSVLQLTVADWINKAIASTAFTYVADVVDIGNRQTLVNCLIDFFNYMNTFYASHRQSILSDIGQSIKFPNLIPTASGLEAYQSVAQDVIDGLSADRAKSIARIAFAYNGLSKSFTATPANNVMLLSADTTTDDITAARIAWRTQIFAAAVNEAYDEFVAGRISYTGALSVLSTLNIYTATGGEVNWFTSALPTIVSTDPNAATSCNLVTTLAQIAVVSNVAQANIKQYFMTTTTSVATATGALSGLTTTLVNLLNSAASFASLDAKLHLAGCSSSITDTYPLADRIALRKLFFSDLIDAVYALIPMKKTWGEALTIMGASNLFLTYSDEVGWYAPVLLTIRNAQTTTSCSSAATLAELTLLKYVSPTSLATYFATTPTVEYPGSGAFTDISNQIVTIFRTTRSFAQLEALLSSSGCFIGVVEAVRTDCETSATSSDLCNLYQTWVLLNVFVTYRVGKVGYVPLADAANIDISVYLDLMRQSLVTAELGYDTQDEIERSILALNSDLVTLSGQLRTNFDSLATMFQTNAAFDFDVAKIDVIKNGNKVVEQRASTNTNNIAKYFGKLFDGLTIGLAVQIAFDAVLVAASVASAAAGWAGFAFSDAIDAGKDIAVESDALAKVAVQLANVVVLRNKFDSLATKMTTVGSTVQVSAASLAQLQIIVGSILTSGNFDGAKTDASAFLQAYANYEDPFDESLVGELNAQYTNIADISCNILNDLGGAALAASQIGGVFPCNEVKPSIETYFDNLNLLLSYSTTFVNSLVSLVRSFIQYQSATTFRNAVKAADGVTVRAATLKFYALTAVISAEIDIQKASVLVCRYYLYTEGGSNGRFHLCDSVFRSGLFFSGSDIINLLSHDPHTTGYTITRNAYLPTKPRFIGDTAYIDMYRLKQTGKASFDIPIDGDFLHEYNFIDKQIDLDDTIYYVKNFEVYLPFLGHIIKGKQVTTGYHLTSTYIKVRSSIRSGNSAKLSKLDSNLYTLPTSVATMEFNNDIEDIWCPVDHIRANPFRSCSAQASSLCIGSKGDFAVKSTDSMYPPLFTRWQFEITLANERTGESIFPLFPLISTEMNIPISIDLFVYSNNPINNAVLLQAQSATTTGTASSTDKSAYRGDGGGAVITSSGRALRSSDATPSGGNNRICCDGNTYRPSWQYDQCVPCPAYSTIALGGEYCALDVATVQHEIDCNRDITFTLNGIVVIKNKDNSMEQNGFCDEVGKPIKDANVLQMNGNLGDQHLSLEAVPSLLGGTRLVIYLTS